MSDKARHAGDRPSLLRRLGGVPPFVLLIAACVLALGSAGTYAYWSDSATVTSGSFTSGSLDLKIGSSAGDQLAGADGTWTYGKLALPLMVPGSTTGKQPVTITNSGNVPVTVTGKVTATSNSLTGNAADQGLAVTVYDGADTSCSVGTALSAILPSTSASTVASGVTLAAGASRTYCVKVDFGVNAPLSMQGLTTSVMIAFTASQVVP